MGRAQLELGQVRQEIDRKIQEKIEEFDNTRKNHQRAMDSMAASLEAESRGKAESLRLKKKLESDINELEIALDHANKANSVRLKVSIQKRAANVQTLLRRLVWLTGVLVPSKVSLRKPELYLTLLTVARSKLTWNCVKLVALSMT